MTLTPNYLQEYAAKIRSEILQADDGIIRFNSDFAEDVFAISQDFNNQYKRRAAIKSASALFESITFELWEQLKKTHNTSQAAKYILTGRSISLADNGKIKEKKAVYPIKIRLRFALAQFNELYDEERKFHLTEKLWKDLDSFYQMRNQLLHPDGFTIAKVSDESLRVAMDLAQNMMTILVLNMNGITIGMAKRNGQDLSSHALHSFYKMSENNFISASNYLISTGILS